MRMLGVLPDEQQARRFGDYLLTRGMENQVEAGMVGWSVWVVDDDHLPAAGTELAAFRADPDAAAFQGAEGDAGRIRTQKEARARSRAGKQVDVRTSWAAAAGRAAPLTVALIALSVLVGLLTQLGTSPTSGPIENLLLLSPPGAEQDYLGLGPILHGEVWRLVTSIFIHFGPLHLLFNMLWLADLGSRVERKRGWVWFGFFVLLVAVTSNLAEHFFDIGLNVPGLVAFGTIERSGGMSGVVYGLFGYVWIRSRLAPYDGLGVSQQTTIMMLAWLVLCMTGMLGSVANVAHLVGLLVGMGVAYAPILRRRLLRR